MLDGEWLAQRVYFDHLVAFPDAAGVVRENAASGVPPHNPAYEFIYALATGLVDALADAVVEDLGDGTADVDGASNPVPFTLPALPSAPARFLDLTGWTGDLAPAAADVFVGAMLTYVQDSARIQMHANKGMGTGNSVISLTTNPTLEDQLKGLIPLKVTAAMQASGYFAKDDVPGNPVNTAILEQLDAYATTYGEAFGSLVAEVSYSGVGGGSAVSGVKNTGGFL